MGLSARRLPSQPVPCPRGLDPAGTGPADRIYAYSTDGLGNYTIIDDANTPSLLSLPYFGFKGNPATMAATRAWVLSPKNPWYRPGPCASGVGSSHTPGDKIWPMALMSQGAGGQDAPPPPSDVLASQSSSLLSCPLLALPPSLFCHRLPKSMVVGTILIFFMTHNFLFARLASPSVVPPTPTPAGDPPAPISSPSRA
eukprot:SAG22_NODE_7708_length_716_cov_0.724473_1_plen_197_part_10